ncbi:unnamed protein product [Prorocentrum cordatum]|uniref:Secreted protein n=1 Tax=Prorocentrum cordatum TaxID=2364126 RepID=A0ABN9TH29_9DINO|nr:unnamed protein product [Polarella glacialis]
MWNALAARWSDQTCCVLLFALFEHRSAVGDVGSGGRLGSWCHECFDPRGFAPLTGENCTPIVESGSSRTPRSQSTSSAFLLQDSARSCCVLLFSGRAWTQSSLPAFLLHVFTYFFRPTCMSEVVVGSAYRARAAC